MDERSVIVKALENDAKRLSVNHNAFIKANDFQYTLAIRTWFDTIRHVSGEKAVIAVSFDVIRQGLVATIEDAVRVSNGLIHGDAEASLPAVWSWVCHNLTLRSALQVLRYLKRFTPIACDVLDAACIQAYKATLNRNKLRDRKEANRYITSRAKDVLIRLLDGLEFGKCMPNGIPFSLYERGYFSSGVTWDSVPNCKATKVAAWHSPFFGDPMYPNLGYKGDDYYWSSIWLHKAVAKCVPKSYKAKRIIAEEEAERQFYMQGMRTVVRDFISQTPYAKNLELDRQESQQRRCFDKRWATLDMSQASDTITVSIANDVLPLPLFNLSVLLRASSVEIDGISYTNTIYQTSGSAWCFDAESLIFFAVCTACQEWKAVFTHEEYVPVFVYGDDIEVDVRCYTECMEWLEALGFIVNPDKSFGPDTEYRESCGVEVLGEYEVSTSYWPRKEIKFHKDSLQSLISLSDRLIAVDWLSAHLYVLDSIHDIVGDKFSTTSVLEPGYSTDPRTVVTPVTHVVSSRRAYATDDARPDYEGHMCVLSRPSKILGIPSPTMENWYYTQFLMHGPRFEDELSALLRTSVSHVDRNDTRCNIRTSVEIHPTI
jgi:hypothetical protein